MRIYFFPFFTGILLGASGYGAPNEKYDQLNMRRGEPGDLAGQANNCLNPDATPSGVVSCSRRTFSTRLNGSSLIENYELRAENESRRPR